jgi:hypothetical protein
LLPRPPPPPPPPPPPRNDVDKHALVCLCLCVFARADNVHWLRFQQYERREPGRKRCPLGRLCAATVFRQAVDHRDVLARTAAIRDVFLAGDDSHIVPSHAGVPPFSHARWACPYVYLMCITVPLYIYITAPLYINCAPIHNTVPLDISLCPHVYHCTPIYITVPLYIHRPIYITLRPYI